MSLWTNALTSTLKSAGATAVNMAADYTVRPLLRSTMREVRDSMVSVGEEDDSISTLIDQTMDKIDHRLNSTVSPHLRDVKTLLDKAIKSLQESSYNSQRRRKLIVNLIPLLTSFTKDDSAFSQIDKEKQQMFFLLIGLLETVQKSDPLLQHPSYLLELLKEASVAVEEGIKRHGGIIQGSIHAATISGQQSAQEIYDHFSLSSTSTEQTSQAIPHLHSSPSEINGMVKEGMKIFNFLISHMENVLSKHVARSLSDLLSLVYTVIRDHLQNNGSQNQEIINSIHSCIERIQKAQREGSWEEMICSLKACFSVLKQQEVYLQGIRLPFNPVGSYSSAVPGLLDLVKSHENILRTPKKSQRITLAKIERMASRLAQRSSAFVSIKIVEHLFRLKIKRSTYPELLQVQDSTPVSAYPKLFRDRFFQYINSSCTNPLYKWTAKIAYLIVHRCAGFYIDLAIDEVKIVFFQWQKKDINTKAKHIIQWTRNCFSIISGVQNQVAHTSPERERDIFLLFNEAIQSPSRNGGLSSKEFYDAMIKTSLQFVRIRWTERVSNHFDFYKIHPNSRFSFMNPFLDPIKFLCKKPIQLFLFFPQTILNFILQKLMGFLIVHSIDLASFIDENLELLRDPLTPISFSIHQLIYTQMSKIAKLIHTRMHLDDNTDLNKQLAPDQQLEVSSCVNSLLEVLANGRHHTVRRLNQHFEADRTLQEHISRELEENSLPQAMPAVALTIWTALQAILKESELLALFHDVLTITDSAFEPPPVTELPFKAIDKGINDLTNEILESMIYYLLNDKLDYNNAKQQRAIAKFTITFKSQTKNFMSDINRQMVIIENSTHSFEDRTRAIREMVILAHSFLNKRIEELGKADGNFFLHPETKNQLHLLTKEFKEKIHPISRIFNEMMRLQNQLNVLEISTTSLPAARDLVHNITDILGTLTERTQGNEANVFQALEQLNHHMERLRNSASEQIGELAEFHSQFLKTQMKVQSAYKNASLLRKNSRLFIQAHRRLMTLAQRNLAYEQHRLKNIKAEMDFYFIREINRAIKKKTHNTPLIPEKNTLLKFHLTALASWEKQVRTMTLHNIVFFNHIEWIQQMIHSFALSRTKAMVDEIRAAFIQRHFYECFIRQAVLSLLQSHGKQFLKPLA